MKNFTLKTILFSFLILSLNSCEINDQNDENFSSKAESTIPQNLEVTCIFAASEIEKYMKYASRLSEFDQSKLLDVIPKVKHELDHEQDPISAGKIFLEYLESKYFLEDTKNIDLDQNFAAEYSKSIRSNQTDVFFVAKKAAEGIAHIVYTTKDLKHNMFSISATQRLSMVNGDTIELKPNVKYPFPTDHFLNNEKESLALTQSEPTWVTGSSKANSIRSEKLEIKLERGTTTIVQNIELVIKTTE